MDLDLLIEHSRKGDISSFMELLKVKQELFYKIAFAYTKKAYDAEDCISDAAIKGFEKIKQLKEPKKFYSWFTSILINVCRKKCREASKCTSEENIKEVIDMFTFSSVDDKIIIKNLLEKLREDEREIIVLRYLKDYSIKDISMIMDIPANTVKTKIYRSLRFLRLKDGGLSNEY